MEFSDVLQTFPKSFWSFPMSVSNDLNGNVRRSPTDTTDVPEFILAVLEIFPDISDVVSSSS